VRVPVGIGWHRFLSFTGSVDFGVVLVKAKIVNFGPFGFLVFAVGIAPLGNVAIR